MEANGQRDEYCFETFYWEPRQCHICLTGVRAAVEKSSSPSKLPLICEEIPWHKLIKHSLLKSYLYAQLSFPFFFFLCCFIAQGNICIYF